MHIIDAAHGKPYYCRRPICSTSQSRVIRRFSKDIANSLVFMTRFISLQARHTSRVRGIFVWDTAITSAPWRSQ